MSSINRRDFLKMVGAGGVGASAGFIVAESAKRPTEQYIPYVVTPEEFSPGIATWFNTVCNQCGAGCGISVRVREGRAKKIEGNPLHPVNQGRTCARGQAGLNQLYNPDRITTPLKRVGAKGSGAFEPVGWEQGLALVAERLAPAGSGSSMRLLTGRVRGHLDALFAELMTGLGSPHYLQYEPTGLETLYAANRLAFGAQRLPYFDLRNADYVLCFGADFLGSWVSPVHHSLTYGHLRQGAERARGHLVQVEPRMSLTGANADEWLAARPGSEGVMALAIAHELLEGGAYRGEDRDLWADSLAPYTAEHAAAHSGIEPATIARVAREFAGSRRALALGGGAAGAGTNGVGNLLAINALNYLAGNLGQPGGVLFNPAPAIPARGEPASYRDVTALLESARSGAIPVMIVHDTNPVYALPAAAGAREALAGIEMLVSLSSFMDETTALADLVLPTHSYLESWWDDSPEPGVALPVASIAQPVTRPLHDTRSVGDIVLGLAAQIGGATARALPWPSMEAYLKGAWKRIYDARSSALEQTSFEEFWQAVLQAGVWGERPSEPPQASWQPQARAQIAPEEARFEGDAAEYPFHLQPYFPLTFYDGRGANLPWLQELPDPLTSVVYTTWVELNPQTAAELGVREGDVLEVRSAAGSLQAPALVYPAIRPDVIAMPVGQGHAHYGRYAAKRGVNPLEILAPLTDPRSGALATAATRVALRATGRRVKLVKTDGVTRTLGRQILGKPGEGGHA